MTPQEMLQKLVDAMNSEDPNAWPDSQKVADLTAVVQAHAAMRQAEATEKIADALHGLIHGGEEGGYWPIKVYDTVVVEHN